MFHLLNICHILLFEYDNYEYVHLKKNLYRVKNKSELNLIK